MLFALGVRSLASSNKLSSTINDKAEFDLLLGQRGRMCEECTAARLHRTVLAR